MSGASSYATRLELLKHVPDPLRSEVAQRLRPHRATKGRTLVEKGSRTTDVFFLVEGRAEVVLYSSNGREVCVNTVSPGAMLGEIAVLDGEPRSASIVALSNVLLVTMRANDFLACVESSPAAGLWLAQRLAAYARRLTEQVFELSALNVRARIHCELLRLARQGVQHNGAIEVRPALTHERFAKRIGTHREAVTREMRALTEAGIIRYGRRTLVIVDPARLEQYVDR